MTCAASALSDLASLYNFNDGTSGAVIGDGGHDMYDSGNYLHVNGFPSSASSGLEYTETCT